MTTKAGSRVVVIGGGLAGLAAAAYAASSGRRVTVLEKATELGGRAATQEKKGFSLNLGPHALYRGGEAERVLAELGVTVPGAAPSLAGYALDGDALRALPTGPVSLLVSSLLPLGAKIEIARMLAGIASADPTSLAGTSAKAFLERSLHAPAALRVAAALVRLSSYSAEWVAGGRPRAISERRQDRASLRLAMRARRGRRDSGDLLGAGDEQAHGRAAVASARLTRSNHFAGGASSPNASFSASRFFRSTSSALRCASVLPKFSSDMKPSI